MARALLACLLFLGCGRSGLEFGELDGDDGFEVDSTDSDPEPPPPGSDDPPCEPTEEICNGVDDDCDGEVDEGLPAEPCANGGARYCVAGAMTECPRACAVCQPSSERVCFVSYCTIWGVQRCESDGRAWRRCREEEPPDACRSEENGFGGAADSVEAEQCCIDQGFCCQDNWDIDGDGDTDEMVGSCDGVSCG